MPALFSMLAIALCAAPLERSKGAIVRGPRTEKRLALVFTRVEYGEGATEILDALRAR